MPRPLRSLLLLLLAPPRAALALDGIWQLQPTDDADANPPTIRSSVHLRHCTSETFVTAYATSGPKDDFKWKFEDALNGESGAVSIRVTTAGYTERYLAPTCDTPQEQGRVCTVVPTADKDMVSWRVESGLCNPGYYSFSSLSKGATAGHYLGLNAKLQGACASVRLPPPPPPPRPAPTAPTLLSADAYLPSCRRSNTRRRPRTWRCSPPPRPWPSPPTPPGCSSTRTTSAAATPQPAAGPGGSTFSCSQGWAARRMWAAAPPTASGEAVAGAAARWRRTRTGGTGRSCRASRWTAWHSPAHGWAAVAAAADIGGLG